MLRRTLTAPSIAEVEAAAAAVPARKELKGQPPGKEDRIIDDKRSCYQLGSRVVQAG